MTTMAAILCGMLLIGNTLLAQDSAKAYHDQPFIQDYSEKIPVGTEVRGAQLMKVRTDRNGRILVLSDKGLLQIYEGRLKPDKLYRPLADMQIRDFDVHQGQFVYLTDECVLSNAWAGRLLKDHNLPDAKLLAMGDDLDSMVVGGDTKQIAFDRQQHQFLHLTDGALWRVTPDGDESVILRRENMTCFALTDTDEILIGSSDGYLRLESGTSEQSPTMERKLPCTDIRCIRPIDGKIWFGTPHGAFAMNHDGEIDYYASKHGSWTVRSLTSLLGRTIQCWSSRRLD